MTGRQSFPQFNFSRARRPGDMAMSNEVQGVFVVGRISKGEKRLVFARSVAAPPFPGPWELRAVFAS